MTLSLETITPATGSNLEVTTMNEIFKLLISQGTEGILPVFNSLMNQAMKIERNNAIGADPYERNSERSLAKMSVSHVTKCSILFT